MKPLRICHSEWSDGFGGQERRILLECVGLQERGHYVEIVTRPSCWIAEEARRRGIAVTEIDMRSKFDFKAIRALAKHLRAEKFDVLHTHSGIDSWIGGIAAKLAKMPALVRTRHLFMPFKRSPLNFVHYLPDRIFCLGETMRRMLVDDCGFPAGQITNIPTGIDFSTFLPERSRAAVREELGIAETTFLVLVVGVIRGVKRHDIALRGFAEMLASGGAAAADSVLVLAGDGPMRAEMERLAAELGLGERIKFLGHRTDVPDLMAAADILLLTSRSEAQSQALTQGIGLGIPAVATAVGGVPEVIIHEQTGLLVPPNEPAPVAAALLRLQQSPDLRRQLGDNGKRHALKRYDLSVMLDDTLRAYADILREKAGR